MPQVSKYPVSDEVYSRMLDIFLKTFSSLSSKNKVGSLFKDFFTPTERVMFAKRLAIGFLLAKGYSYYEISETLRVSSTTVSYVSNTFKTSSYLKGIVIKLIKDEEMEEFWMKLNESIAGVLSHAKGGRHHRYLKEEIRKERQKRVF